MADALGQGCDTLRPALCSGRTDRDSNPVHSHPDPVSLQLGTEHNLFFLLISETSCITIGLFVVFPDKQFVSREGCRHQLLLQNTYIEQVLHYGIIS